MSKPRIALFVVACLLGGFGGVAGSILGHAFGKTGLWVGGIIGGLLMSIATARIALWRRWIAPSQLWPTTLGAAVGFLLAAAIAVNTLSSPIGPILSTLLIGLGALAGSMRVRSIQ
jgi:Mg/Co/Ni transporter MgtE